MPNRAGKVSSGGGSPMGKSSPNIIIGGITAVMRNPAPSASAAQPLGRHRHPVHGAHQPETTA
jgi:hypothetical protein